MHRQVSGTLWQVGAPNMVAAKAARDDAIAPTLAG
jgi:hypothetical protein